MPLRRLLNYRYEDLPRIRAERDLRALRVQRFAFHAETLALEDFTRSLESAAGIEESGEVVTLEQAARAQNG